MPRLHGRLIATPGWPPDSTPEDGTRTWASLHLILHMGVPFGRPMQHGSGRLLPHGLSCYRCLIWAVSCHTHLFPRLDGRLMPRLHLGVCTCASNDTHMFGRLYIRLGQHARPSRSESLVKAWVLGKRCLYCSVCAGHSHTARHVFTLGHSNYEC